MLVISCVINSYFLFVFFINKYLKLSLSLCCKLYRSFFAGNYSYIYPVPIDDDILYADEYDDEIEDFTTNDTRVNKLFIENTTDKVLPRMIDIETRVLAKPPVDCRPKPGKSHFFHVAHLLLNIQICFAKLAIKLKPNKNKYALLKN